VIKRLDIYLDPDGYPVGSRPAYIRQFIKLKPGEHQQPEAPEGYRMELDADFRERIMSTIKAERIRKYADELDQQQPCVQPSMKMVIVAMLRHVADAIEGKNPPPWKKVTPP
jgi:hypothetical protein